MYVDVAFPISNYQVFTYNIEKDLSKDIKIGTRVLAPIGRIKREGVVIKISDRTEYPGKLKTITKIIDKVPIFDEKLWQLIVWMSNYYFTPIGKAATVIPNNLSTEHTLRETWYVKSIQKKAPENDLKKRAPVQYKALKELLNFDKPVPVSTFKKLSKAPVNVFSGLEKKGYVRLFKKEIEPDDSFSFKPIQKKVEFSAEQKKALKALNNYFNKKKKNAFLLHGVTGSGKTEIYIKAAEETIKKGKSVIILLPEIALTPQIAGRIRAVFGNKVGLWHSKMSKSARDWTWTNICNGKYSVIVGARSAIFAPLKNLGLIIVDEEQEASYKQQEPEPHYNARDVALVRGRINGARVLLVSATPSIESYYNHIMNKYDYFYLSERYKKAVHPKVTVVDMIREQEETGKLNQIFSGALQEKIVDRLNKNEQIILLQNRRGYAPVYRCNDCGKIVSCTTCSIPLTYHKTDESLKCHFCGYVLNTIPVQCESCDSSKLYLSGTGTQKVESYLQETFNKARIERIDVDTVGTGASLNKRLQDFNDGKTDILLGTQIIAKGLDFGNVTLVGIINADTGLFLPDFRSGEKVFQLVYQASGRSGRHNLPGEVVVQTYNLDNPVIRYAARLDLKKYYNILIGERQELNYPPFTWLIKAVFMGNNKSKVAEYAEKLRREMPGRAPGIEILGPSWCYREKLRGVYRNQIVLKSSKLSDNNSVKLHKFVKKYIIEKKLINGVRLSVDVDPVSLL